VPTEQSGEGGETTCDNDERDVALKLLGMRSRGSVVKRRIEALDYGCSLHHAGHRTL
jgi:hypothetical protein